MTNRMCGSILIVDDAENWRNLLTAVLTEDGHHVVTASNFQQAKSLLQNEQFDLVTLDMRLVDEAHYNIQGIAILKEVKNLRPSTKAIILTGYPDPDQREKALSFYSADGYYEKAPGGESFDINSFSELVFELLQK